MDRDPAVSLSRTSVNHVEDTMNRAHHRATTNLLVVQLDAGGPLNVAGDRVLVVAPAVNSRLRRWVSDEDGARRAAADRLAEYLEALEQVGVHASGRIGDADAVQAIADTLPTFRADAIVIAARDERTRRRARDVATRARRRFGLPVVDACAPVRRAAQPSARTPTDAAGIDPASRSLGWRQNPSTQGEKTCIGTNTS